MSISFVVDFFFFFFVDWFLIFGISSPWFSLVFELYLQKDELSEAFCTKQMYFFSAAKARGTPLGTQHPC